MRDHVKVALIAGIVAAVVASASAMAASSGIHTGPAPQAPHGPEVTGAAHAAPQPKQPAPPASRKPLSNAAVQSMVAAWSKAHLGWKNPANMTHAEMLQAAIEHPAVYAPNLNRSSVALRIVEQYGADTTLPASVLALMRAQGYPIPADLPHVPLSALVPASRLALIKAALAAARKP